MEAAAERLEYGEPEVERRGPWRQAARRFWRQKLAVVALFVLVAIFVVGASAGVIAPYAYDKIDISKIGKPPSSPSWAHPFGTDDLGHDMLSQTLYGIRTTVKVVFIVAGVAAAIGIAVGGIAGYYRGWADRFLSAITDGFVAMPALLAALIAVSAFKNISVRRIALTLAIVLWPSIARVVRASFVSLREREYVEAARASGASDARIIFRHLLPNTAGVIIVAVTSVIGASIILEATVDFFNYGLVGALKPTLGSLLADATKNGVGNSWWWLYVIPAIVIGVLLVCVNFVGDSLDEALNPARALRR
jgi:peptide/nickel transport system permease protein